MILESGQWRVRDLVMGPHTNYRVTANSNSFTLGIRAPQSRNRPHAHGGLVGSEWANPKVIPITVMVDASPYTETAWLDAVDELTAAFEPVGDSGETVELYRNIDGREFVWFGRTRLVEPETDLAAGGYGFVQCAFEAADPRRYSAELSSASTGLPVTVGGLTLPMTLPMTVDGVLVSGRLELTNSGTTATGLKIRIDGPATDPRVILRSPDGSVTSIVFDRRVSAGQWLEIDTTSRLALQNGLPQANQRGRATFWDMDAYPLLPGVSELRFGAAEFEENALITVEHRSAWW